MPPIKSWWRGKAHTLRMRNGCGVLALNSWVGYDELWRGNQDRRVCVSPRYQHTLKRLHSNGKYVPNPVLKMQQFCCYSLFSLSQTRDSENWTDQADMNDNDIKSHGEQQDKRRFLSMKTMKTSDENCYCGKILIFLSLLLSTLLSHMTFSKD